MATRRGSPSETPGQRLHFFHIRKEIFGRLRGVLGQLRKFTADFIRTKRGTMGYEEFSQRSGLSVGSVVRVERGEQGLTIDLLEHVLLRLKCTTDDVFPPGVPAPRSETFTYNTALSAAPAAVHENPPGLLLRKHRRPK